jgi:type VI protein secretion system component VasF
MSLNNNNNNNNGQAPIVDSVDARKTVIIYILLSKTDESFSYLLCTLVDEELGTTEVVF